MILIVELDIREQKITFWSK